MSQSRKQEPQDLVSNRSVSDGAEGPLDTNAKSVDRRKRNTSRKQSRMDRFRWQRHAACLLGGKGRVGLCRYTVVSETEGVDVVRSTYGDDPSVYAHYEGLQTCGSVWDCPCCAARISETRRSELNRLLAWARAQNYTIQMITLTARHGRTDRLARLLGDMKKAKQRWGQTRAYRRIKPVLIGSVTATEVTGGGAHGWHPHFHIIVITREEVDLNSLRDAWLSSLSWAGLDGTGAGWRVQDATEAGNYMAKWGAAEELTMGAKKRGRGGMTPTQLLASSCDEGDVQAGRLWREYSAAFKGRRQLVWSRGLKRLALIDEVEDIEAASNEAQADQAEAGRDNVSTSAWNAGARRRRGRILDAAEDDGALGIARVLAEEGADPKPGDALNHPIDDEDVDGGLVIYISPEEMQAMPEFDDASP